MRLEITAIAMQTQSNQANVYLYLYRLSILLGISPGLGAKALEKLQPATQALAQKQQQLGLSMQAVAYRLVAMEQAEKIVKEQMQKRPRRS